jgi:YaiO family outer membrane protein
MTSRQSELEFYPHIRPGTYMYLGAGYSNDRRLYPRFRGGAELFQSVGHGWELSGGMRTMAFSDQVNIYTASVGKYRGNWYYSVRTFVTPGDSGLSRSFQFQARRYFGSSGTDYVGFRLGGGTSPAEIRSIADIAILNQFSSGFETYRRISRLMTLSGRLGLSREDRLYRSELMHYYADLGMQFRF